MNRLAFLLLLLAAGIMPHGRGGIGVSQIQRGAVVQNVVGIVEFRNDLLKIVRRKFEAPGQNAVIRIEEVIPLATRERLDAAGEDVPHCRIADLRTEADEDLALDRVFIAYKRVVADQ